MARICFTWELGQGYGHLVRYRHLIECLFDDGHTVTFLTKDAARARSVFDGMPLAIIEIEPGKTPPQATLPLLNSIPDLLHNVGFFEAEHLDAQLSQWITQFDRLAPDVLVVDHSPSALLASRFFRVATISSGTGFTVPPLCSPMRPFRYWSMLHREDLGAHEESVLRTCNEVLVRGAAKPLAALYELFATDAEWLLTFAELDHYGERGDARYLGSFPGRDFGEPPRWTDFSGPKVFVYLSAPTLPENFAHAVRVEGVNVCLFAPQLRDGELAKLPVAQVRHFRAPLDLSQVAVDAQAVITNGGLNTVAAVLREGLPQLVLPNNMERHMVGRRLELLGAGLMASKSNSGNLAAKLHAVIHDRAFSRGAEMFARRYVSSTATQQTDAMLDDIKRLLRSR